MMPGVRDLGQVLSISSNDTQVLDRHGLSMHISMCFYSIYYHLNAKARDLSSYCVTYLMLGRMRNEERREEREVHLSFQRR